MSAPVPLLLIVTVAVVWAACIIHDGINRSGAPGRAPITIREYPPTAPKSRVGDRVCVLGLDAFTLNKWGVITEIIPAADTSPEWYVIRVEGKEARYKREEFIQ